MPVYFTGVSFDVGFVANAVKLSDGIIKAHIAKLNACFFISKTSKLKIFTFISKYQVCLEVLSRKVGSFHTWKQAYN